MGGAPISIGGDYTYGSAQNGEDVHGVAISLGVEASLPVELHAQLVNTNVMHIKDVLPSIGGFLKKKTYDPMYNTGDKNLYQPITKFIIDRNFPIRHKIGKNLMN